MPVRFVIQNMAGLARPRSCHGMLLALVSLLHLTRGSASRMGRVASSAARHGAGMPGTGCVVLQHVGRESILTTVPPDIYLIISRRNLTREYSALAESLYHAPRGKGNAWKCSALARVLYLRGYEEMFSAKGVSIYLTKKRQRTVGGSKVQVCLVDRAQEPRYVPSNVYTDGGVLDFKAGSGCASRRRQCDEVRGLQAGVYALLYDGFRALPSDKTSLPVGLMKLLEEKDAVVLNMDMVAMIGTGSKTGFAAALAVDRFRQSFNAKGIDVFYNQHDFSYTCCDDAGCTVCHEWHHWFEYVDTRASKANYRPTVSGTRIDYPKAFVAMHKECLGGDASRLAARIRTHAGLSSRPGGCRSVAGATERFTKKHPNCKCQAREDSVYCGDEVVAKRKFNVESAMSLAACRGREAYCSSKPCMMPTGLRP